MSIATDPPSKNLLRGVGASIITIAITYPVSKIVYRQIINNISAWKAILQIKNEGLRYLFRGALPPSLQKTISICMMYSVQEDIHNYLDTRSTNRLFKNCAGGIISGGAEAIFMPLERIQFLLVHAKYNQEFRNMFDTFKSIRKQYGLREWYRGFTVVVVRNIVSNCVFYIVKEKLQIQAEKYATCTSEKTAANFTSGAILGVLLTVMCHPLKVLKVELHKQLGGPFQSPIQTLPKIYIQGGRTYKVFLSGIGFNNAKSVLSFGVANAAYEHLKIFC